MSVPVQSMTLGRMRMRCCTRVLALRLLSSSSSSGATSIFASTPSSPVLRPRSGRLSSTPFPRQPSSTFRVGLSLPTSRPYSSFIDPAAPRPSGSPRPPRRFRRLLLVLAPVLLFTFFPTSKPKALNPQSYSDHATASLSPRPPSHAVLTVPLKAEEANLFSTPFSALEPMAGGSNKSSEGGSDQTVVIHHVMVKSPDLQIERPYTPVNDVEADGELKLLVKRVRGGEVGRLVHSLKPGDPVGLRGPITTFSLDPTQYDKIVMISTGTAVAPFLQLLSKLSPSSSSPTLTPSSSSSSSSAHSPALPTFHLLHALPTPGKPDITSDFLSSLQTKWGPDLVVERFDLAQGLQKETVRRVIKGKERVMVLVCLPPRLMRPLCGPLTPMLEQGPLTGTLAELGLTADQVWKLE